MPLSGLKETCLAHCFSTYSTPRRSLCVRPDAGRVWTIFPPTHWTHEYLASRPANARTDTQTGGRTRRSTDGHAEARTDTQTGGRTRRSSDADARTQTQKHGRRRRRTDAEAKIIIYNYVTVHAIGKIDFEI